MPYRLAHHTSPINNTCIGTRNHNAVAGFPRSSNPSRAALTFAGNIAISKIIRHTPVKLRTFGSNNPAAPRNSNTPVAYTIHIGFGKTFGTICSKSCFMPVKCALPVSINITAKA